MTSSISSSTNTSTSHSTNSSTNTSASSSQLVQKLRQVMLVQVNKKVNLLGKPNITQPYTNWLGKGGTKVDFYSQTGVKFTDTLYDGYPL